MDFVRYQSCHGIINKARTNTSLNRKARVHCWRSEGSSELFSPDASVRGTEAKLSTLFAVSLPSHPFNLHCACIISPF
jgi:hypothetical protein